MRPGPLDTPALNTAAPAAPGPGAPRTSLKSRPGFDKPWAMTLEQRPELNRFVDPFLIAPWKYRWQRIKLLMPVWTICFLFLLELSVVAMWLSDKPVLEALAIAAGGSLAPFAFILALFEVCDRFGHGEKRRIEFEPGTILVGSSPKGLQWNEVVKFQFEPVAALPGATKFFIFRRDPRKRKGRVSRDRVVGALVIENADQARELLDYVRNRKAKSSMNFEIAVLDAPSPLWELPSRAFWGLMVSAIGYFFFVHGPPILLKLMGMRGDSGERLKLTPERAAKLQHFMNEHFPTYAAFHHFFLTLGIVLTVAGIVLMLVGRQLGKQKWDPASPERNR